MNSRQAVEGRVLDVARARCDQYTTQVAWALLASWLVLAALVVAPALAAAPDPEGKVSRAEQQDRSRLHEPIYRIAKVPGESATSAESADPGRSRRDSASRPEPVTRQVTSQQSRPAEDRLAAKTGETPRSSRELVSAHPLDPGLALARETLARIQRDVRDYTCTMVKRERVDGELLDHEFMTCKIRRPNGDKPFAVYLAFRKPEAVRGREVIYVAGRNEGKLIAHEGGFKGRFIPTVHLNPTSALAMRGNRYPITEIGLETLTRRLIEKGERDRKHGDCHVRLVDGVKVGDRGCTMLEVKHPQRKPVYDFHLARVFLDNELKVPIRYEAYDWPTTRGGRPRLQEEYTYMNLRLNVGLDDSHFDVENPEYRF